jgi:hypothetical protein
MICRIDFFERVLLIGHNPPTVYATTAGHIEHLQRKPDGHYAREDLMPLVEEGTAVLYNEATLRDVLEALPYLVHGCPDVG